MALKNSKNAESKVESKSEVKVSDAAVADTAGSENVTAEEVAPEKDDSIVVGGDEKEDSPVSVQKTEKEPTKKCKANRIKMRCDHTCHIGGEWYYLKAGVCYNVDDNVKSILDGAGLLAPL